MKLLKNLREIVLAIGIILIALRLYYPVNEYQVYSDGIRIKYSSLNGNKEKIESIEKTIVVSKTIFQTIGIALLTGGFVLIYELKRKKDS